MLAEGELSQVGWPGMFGETGNETGSLNTTHDQSLTRYLLSGGPWTDKYNRYVFKDNRPYNPVAHSVKLFAGGTWRRYASLLPHRRPVERDGTYEGELVDYTFHYVSSYYVGYDAFKFYRVFKESYTFIDVTEHACGYDNGRCAAAQRLKRIIIISMISGLVLILVIVVVILESMRIVQYNMQVGAMKWNLDFASIDFNIGAAGMLSTRAGTNMGTMMGTQGGVGSHARTGTEDELGEMMGTLIEGLNTQNDGVSVVVL